VSFWFERFEPETVDRVTENTRSDLIRRYGGREGSASANAVDGWNSRLSPRCTGRQGISSARRQFGTTDFHLKTDANAGIMYATNDIWNE
jgi:hypothetical protein